MFLGMGMIMLNLLSWNDFHQLLEDIKIISGTLLISLAGVVLNAFLAVGSWKILAYKGWKKNSVLFFSVGIAAFFVVSNVIGLVALTNGKQSLEIDYSQTISSALICLGYVYLAVSLARIATFSNKAPQLTPKSGAAEL